MKIQAVRLDALPLAVDLIKHRAIFAAVFQLNPESLEIRHFVSPLGITIYGFTFQPQPKSRAASDALPSPISAIPPFPFSPVLFSGETEKLSASFFLVKSFNMISPYAEPLRRLPLQLFFSAL